MPGTIYGPDNPHPFSTIRTELIWEGKYDAYGNRREVDIAGAAMPLQKIETVDEPRSRAEVQGTLFDPLTAHRDDFRNMLIWGDNKLVMASLLKDFKGKIDLIYIDPPFDVGADFTMEVPIGDGKDAVGKDQSTLEMVAYRDMWGRGVDSYLQMIYERLILLRELLSEQGSIYVHCDYRVDSFIRLMLDEIFGKENLINEIIWCYKRWTAKAKAFQKLHDTIYFYSKTKNYIFNQVFTQYADKEAHFTEIDENGEYRWQYLNGKKYKLYKKEGVRMGDWWNIPYLNSMALERTGYNTQKPEELLDVVIKASTNNESIVADFFCGSGTTGAVAERLGRRWIMADLGRFAIHTSRKRLIELQRQLHTEHQPYRSFDIYNLGRYERQWWQKEALAGADAEHRRVVLGFYRAEPLAESPSPLLHGRKAGAFVHVANIDSIFTREDAQAVALAAAQAGGKAISCLAWEFEMDLRMHCDALEKELGVQIKLVRIPREIMERNRKEPPPFLEVASLQAQPIINTTQTGKTVDIKLTRFLPSLSEVPAKELDALRERATQSGFDFIDFWAVDFNYHHEQPFNHHWQAYRTRKERHLPTVTDQKFTYPAPGVYTACVKVVDVFGADTSITVEVIV